MILFVRAKVTKIYCSLDCPGGTAGCPAPSYWQRRVCKSGDGANRSAVCSGG